MVGMPPPHVLHDCTNKEMLQCSYSQCLTGDVIKKAANHTNGAAGLSVVDEYAWQWICTSFGDVSTSLCEGLAFVAHYLSTITVNSTVLMPFVACRLIQRDKRPGV